jgi:hypothetical protein
MAWETRKRGGKYFTQSIRVSGRVVRCYWGHDELATLMARSQALEREQKRQEKEEEALTELRFACTDRALEEAWQDANRAAATFLQSAGYHNHRGQWRKRRDKASDPDTEQQTERATSDL